MFFLTADCELVFANISQFPLRTITLRTPSTGFDHSDIATVVEQEVLNVIRTIRQSVPAEHITSVLADATRRIEELSTRLQELSQHPQARATVAAALHSLHSSATVATMETTARPRTARRLAKEEPRLAITTTSSLLPLTTYNEKNESRARALPYVTVQRVLLSWLGKHASDTLTPRQARRWTQAIQPNTRKPGAQDALRLCYYMASQGFDTYAKLKDRSIVLFVANQASSVRGEDYDHIYWKQNFKTNVIESVALSTLPSRPTRTSRRNAIAISDQIPYGHRWSSGVPNLSTNSNENAWLGDGEEDDGLNPENVDGDEDGHDDGIEPGATVPQALSPDEEHARLQVGMAQAQATLNALLSTDDQNPK